MNTTTPKRTIALVRVSGDPRGRADESHDAQRERIVAFCAANGFPAPIVITEIRTATRDTIDARPVLRGLLADIREGDRVIVTKQDRLARNTLVYLQIVKLLRERGAGFFSIAEQFDPDTPQGRYAATIMAATAEHEAACIRERMVGARQRLRDQGLWAEGLPPTGYRVEKRRLLVVPDEKEIVLEAARRCIAGEALSQLVNLPLPADGRRARWDKGSIGGMLRNRVYLGELRDSQGRWVKGQHEAILDEATFAAVQTALDGRRNKRGPSSGPARTEGWLLRALASCSLCGRRMGPVYSGGECDYYGCAGRLAGRGCKARYVRVPDADAAAGQIALRLLVEMRRELGAAVPQPTPARAQKADAGAERKALEERRARVLDLYEGGRIDKDELERRLGRIAAALRALDEHPPEPAPPVSPTITRELLGRSGIIERAWAAATVPERRAIVAQLASRIELLAGEPPRLTLKTPEQLAA